MSDYGEYNGDTVHDMWVDYTYQEYTGGSGGGSYGNHCGGYYGSQPRKKSVGEQMAMLRNRIKHNKERIERLEAQKEEVKKKLENPNLTPRRAKSLEDAIRISITNALAGYEAKIQKDEDKLISLQIEHEKGINAWTIIFCVVAILLAFFLFLVIFK